MMAAHELYSSAFRSLKSVPLEHFAASSRFNKFRSTFSIQDMWQMSELQSKGSKMKMILIHVFFVFIL